MVMILREKGKVYLDTKGNMFIYDRKRGKFVRLRRLSDIKKVM